MGGLVNSKTNVVMVSFTNDFIFLSTESSHEKTNNLDF